MPKVTLLADDWCTRSVMFGKATFAFAGGVVRENIPPAVALHCSKQKTEDGSNIFRVEDLPKVLDAVTHGPRKQNVVPSPRQMRFDKWH